MPTKYFMKVRDGLFPDIKDFSKSQNKYKKSDTRTLDWYTWFWFHPTAYSWIKVSFPLTNAIAFCSLGVWLIYNKIWVPSIIVGIISIYYSRVSLKRMKLLQDNKDITFYDMMIKD